MEEAGNPFSAMAEQYDRWYDTAFGAAAFRQEISCLRLACPEYSGNWLEVGVGSGRFARELGIGSGLDPAPEILHLAAARGIEVHQGCAEALPFPDATFDGVLLAFALCFLADPGKALQECHRVLRPSGSLLLGFVPSGSSWGRHYVHKASAGHPLYSKAVFYKVAEIMSLIGLAGFSLTNAASALLLPPEVHPDPNAEAIPGADENAGFVALQLIRRKKNDDPVKE